MKSKFLISVFLAFIVSTLGLLIGFRLIEQKYADPSLGKQKATLGVQDHLAQACTEPLGGCNEDWYYWNSDTCSCKPHNNSSCTEPAGDCGIDHYWDSSSCSCQPFPTTTCTEPSGGCGYNHYWDSGSCSCEFYCPPSTCGTDEYWDSSSCSCVYSGGGGGGGCTEPVSGCGMNYYWDSSSCSCAYSGNTCQEPAGGCGSNHYWDFNSCSCVYSGGGGGGGGGNGGCTEPTGGCGGGFYWESYNCSCKSTSTCTSPSNGCLENNYWDSYACLCKPNCTEPTGGCGENTYWDFYQCSCTSYNDATYHSGYEEEDFDRLAYESEEIISCIKGILTQSEYEILRYQMGITDEQRNEKRRLGDKVMSCWGGGDGIEGEKCLIDGVGETAYQEIYQGKREPTHDEHLWFEKCYGEVQHDSVSYYRDDQNIPVEVDNCLRSVLVGGLYQKIKSGQLDVPPELRGRVDQCFGAKSQPFEEGGSYELPDEINNCLLQAVGEARFNQINSGQSEPTDEEKRKGDICFGKLNKDQTKFLPLPPEQVPYLESDPETIRFRDIVQDTKKVGDKTVGGKIVFSGKGPPNSVVNIYIYSEPIVVTTKTDENGDWIYELNQPLKGEKHIAYAIVRDNSGKIVRSTVFDFQVAAAELPLGQSFLEESKATVVQTNFLLLAFVMVGFVTAAVMGSIAYMQIRKFNLSVNKEDNTQSPDGTKGKGKGNSGTGSIN